MKHRKIPSLPTKEDRLIWLRLNIPLRRPPPRIMVSAAYREADRRDAELMLGIQRLRADGWSQPLSVYFREGRENIERILGGRLP